MRVAKSSSVSPGLRAAIEGGQSVWRMPAIGRSKSMCMNGSPARLADADGRAVIALHPRNDLLLARPADGVVVVPDQLDRGVVRLGTGVVEEHLRHRHRHQPDQLLCQHDRGGMRALPERGSIGQLQHLPIRCLCQALFAEAQADAPQAAHGVDVFAARPRRSHGCRGRCVMTNGPSLSRCRILVNGCR